MHHVYAESLEPDSSSLTLSPEISRHLEALRIRDGEEVLALNGRGLVARVQISRTADEFSAVVLSDQLIPEPEPLILALGCLDHRDRFEFAVEKAVELGATRIVPLHTTRVQRAKVNIDRLNTKAVAALTQSGRTWLPQVTEISTIANVLETAPSNAEIIVGEQHGEPPSAVPLGNAIVIAVGPEGGFTDDELKVLRSDPRMRSMAIGHHRLRAETAAVALLAVVASRRP